MSTCQKIQYINKDESYIFKCPHCELAIQVDKNQVNCHIFVHGQIKSTATENQIIQITHEPPTYILIHIIFIKSS